MASTTSTTEYPIRTRVIESCPSAMTEAEATRAYREYKASESGIRGRPIKTALEGPFDLAGRIGYRSKQIVNGLEYANCHWRHVEGTGKPYGNFRAGRENESYIGGSCDVPQSLGPVHSRIFTVEPMEYSVMSRQGIETIESKFRVLQLLQQVHYRDAPTSPGENFPPAFTVVPVRIPSEHDFYTYVPGKGRSHWRGQDGEGREVTFFKDGDRSGTIEWSNFDRGSYQRATGAGMLSHKWKHFRRNQEDLTEHSVSGPGLSSVVEVPRGYSGPAASNVTLGGTGFIPVSGNTESGSEPQGLGGGA